MFVVSTMGCGACSGRDEEPGLVRPRAGFDDAAFQNGLELFQKPYGDGQSCASCHHVPDLGGEGLNAPAEVVHPDGHESLRVAPPLYGLGYLDAVELDEQEVLDGCGVDTKRGIHGHPAYGGLLGTRSCRYFAKATSTGLQAAVTSELFHRLGQTSWGSPDEVTNTKGVPVDVSVNEVQALYAFVAGLELPPPLPEDAEGRDQFVSVGCAVCHRLDRQGTDLCLHDMGPGLADQQATLYAMRQEWKTSRLVGVRFREHLLHDGRAGGNVRLAVLSHAGEAAQVVEAFSALSSEKRLALLHFVEGL